MDVYSSILADSGDGHEDEDDDELRLGNLCRYGWGTPRKG